MNEELSQKDIELLEYYHKKKRKNKIIVFLLVVVLVICLVGFIGYSIYSQTHWETRQSEITIEYGETYEPVLAALVDTGKYPFITLDNTAVSSDLKKEDGKDYLAIGNYEIKISHNGNIKIFDFEKSYKNEKTISLIVKDTTPPTIKAPESIEMLLGQSLDMKQYLYLFEVNDLSETTEIELDASNVDNNAVGKYLIKASVEDIYGNKQTCDVPCSVITDPYGDEGKVEIETTTESETKTTTQKTTEAEKKTEVETTNKAVTDSNKATTKKSSIKYTNKDFLFKDGYTMSNVSEAATEYLRASGKAGECIPLKDADGIYIGMRVIIYD